jgi:hypothetical protein
MVFDKLIAGIFLVSLSSLLMAQPEAKVGLKYVRFECWTRTDSIQLPADCIDPEYYSTEEGPIIDFKFKHGGQISILCAGNSYMSVGDHFIAQDTVMINGKIESIRYYDKSINLYARADKSLGYGTYYYVPASRKEEFDKVFDAICLKVIRQRELKNKYY